MYTGALGTAAEPHAGPPIMSAIDAAAAALGAHVTDAQAWPVLRRNLALLAAEGHDPINALHDAARTPLATAPDPAPVPDWPLPTPPAPAPEPPPPLPCPPPP